MSRTLHLVPVEGRVPYRVGLEWQRRLAAERIAGRLAEDVVLLLEHEPVVTLGRGATADHVTAPPESLARAGVERFEVERGGDVTYHGPGQLVGYPILDLRGFRQDLHWYLRRLEEALVVALGLLGPLAFRVPRHTGVWVGDEEALGLETLGEERRSAGAVGPSPIAARERPEGTDGVEAAVRSGRVRKVASIGVHVSRWVTWHGFALNVTNEAARHFDLIVPCGIPDVRITSLEVEGAPTDERAVRSAIAAGFARAFESEARLAPPVGAGGRIELGAAVR